MISVVIAALVFAQKAPTCASDADCAKPKFCACERRVDCTWWPPGFLLLGEKMSYAQITRRTKESACLTEGEAIEARATIADQRARQEYFDNCFADQQCPAGNACVCDKPQCSLRPIGVFYLNPTRPPYTTHMCIPKDSLNDLVRVCGTRSFDRCGEVDGGTPASQRYGVLVPPKGFTWPSSVVVNAGCLMSGVDGGC